MVPLTFGGGRLFTPPPQGSAAEEAQEILGAEARVVAEAHVGNGIVMKRFAPRGRGRSGRVFKPFSQLTIVVRQVEAEASA